MSGAGPVLRARAHLPVATAVGLATAGVVAVSLLHGTVGVHVAGGVDLLAATATAGIAVYALLSAGPSPHVRRAGELLAVVGVAAALATVLFEMTAVGGGGLGGLTDGLAREDTLAGTTYAAALVRCVGLVTVVAGLREVRHPAVLGAGAVVIAASYAVTGHAHTTSPAAVAAVVAGLHVLAASTWFGGLAGLTLDLAGQSSDPDDGRTAIANLRAFARLMTVVLALLTATGIGLAVLYLPRVSSLVDTVYGQVLLVKLAVLVGVLVVSAANHHRLVPIVAAGGRRARRVLVTNITAEQIGLVAVLLVTDVLMRQDPL